MVIDASAIVAILFGEPRPRSSPRRSSRMVESELGDPGARELDLLLYQAGITIVPFAPEHLAAARHAFRTFGKGRHAAALNFGDCFSYALSRSTGEPLLFKGENFPRTDVGRCPLA